MPYRKLTVALCLLVVGWVLSGAALPAGADNLCKPAAPSPQSKCGKDAQCCAGFICAPSADGNRCQSGCRVDGVFYPDCAICPCWAPETLTTAPMTSGACGVPPFTFAQANQGGLVSVETTVAETGILRCFRNTDPVDLVWDQIEDLTQTEWDACYAYLVAELTARGFCSPE